MYDKHLKEVMENIPFSSHFSLAHGKRLYGFDRPCILIRYRVLIIGGEEDIWYHVEYCPPSDENNIEYKSYISIMCHKLNINEAFSIGIYSSYDIDQYLTALEDRCGHIIRE